MHRFVTSLHDDDVEFVGQDWPSWARANQLPSRDGRALADFHVWLVLGGRGAGKTRCGAEWVRHQAQGLWPLATAPARRIALIGPTIGQVRSVMVEGDSGLLNVHPGTERPRFEPSLKRLVWADGSVAEMFSAELAKWRYPQETWDMLQFGLRLGDTFRIADGEARGLLTAREEASLYAAAALPRRGRHLAGVPVTGQPAVVFFDGALLRDADKDWPGYIAAYLRPWPGGVAFYRSPTTSGFALDSVLNTRATMGELAFDFHSGPAWRWDTGNELWIDMLDGGTLSSAEEIAVLGGENAVAVENADGEWEIVQFVTAGGQRGSEHARRSPMAAGARVLILDLALDQPELTPDDIGLPITWRPGRQGAT